MMRDLRRTVIGQLTVELFKTFFLRSVQEKKAQREAFKKMPGRFPKALCYIGIQCRKSAGRK